MNEENEKIKTKTEQEIEDLNEYLSGIEPGYTVVIHRLEPSWCSGLLDEVSISETSKPIDLRYLINTWGGAKLRLKFRNPRGQWTAHRDIELRTFPPLLFGQPLKQERSPHMPEEIVPSPPIHVPPPVPPPAQTNLDILGMMKMMQEMRAADMNAMSAWMQALAAQQHQPQQPQIDPMRMMQGAIGLLGQFQQMRLPSAPEQNENDEVLSLLGKLAGVFTQNQQAPSPARITPGEAQTMQTSGVIGALATMEPQQTISTLQGAVAQMSPEKQAATMGELLSSIENIGGTDLLLDQLEKRGIFDPDDDGSYEETSDDGSPDSRREHGPNAGNDSADRESD